MANNAKKNYVYNSIYSILNMFLPLVTTPYLARVIGVDGVGAYAYSFSIAQFFVIIAKLGLTNYGTREIARNRGDKDSLSKVFANLYTMQCVSTAIVVCVYSVYAVFFSAEYKRLAFIFLVWVVGSFLDIDWFWFGLEEFKKVTIRNVIIKLLTMLCVFLFVDDKADVFTYACIMVIGYLAGYCSIWCGIKGKIRFVKADWGEIRRHLSPCLLMLIPVLALNIYRSMDKVMLGAMVGIWETGIYDNGEKLIYCLSGFIASLGTVMLPRISYLKEQGNEKQIDRYISMSLKFVIFMTSIMTFGLIAVANSLVYILFGEEFTASAIILKLCSPTLLFMGWGNVIRMQYVIPHKRDDIYIKSILYGSICNLVINAVLIPRYASVGAVIGTLVAEFFVPFYQFLRLRKTLNYCNYLKYTVPYVVIGFVMTLFLKIVEKKMGISVLTLIVQIGLGAILFLGGAVFYIIRYDQELLLFIRNILKREVKKEDED